MARRLAMLLLLALLSAGPAGAATIAVPGGAEHIALGDAFDHRTDPSGLMDAADVAADHGAFRAVARQELNLGFSRDAHWLRVTLVNATDAPLTRWLQVGHPRLESVRLFWREGDSWRASAAGTQVSRSQKAIVATTAVLPLTLAPREERTLFVRVASRTLVDMDAALWEPMAFRDDETGTLLARTAFLSAMLLAGGFAFLIYLLMRDRIYLLFALALLFQTAFEACMAGLVPRYLWPADRPFATELISFCGGSAVFFHTLFVAGFLDLRRTLPFWNRVVVGLAGLALLALLGAVVHDYRLWAQVVSIVALAATMLTPFLGLALLRRGYRPARFLLAGMAILWVAVFITQAMQLGLLPVWAPAWDSVPPATVLATMLILLAITERSRELGDALARAIVDNEAKSTFLTHMSHELRTPLSTVIGFARLLRKGSASMAPVEAGRAIERSGLHLLSMIDELLDHARGELGRLHQVPAPIAWSEFIEAMAEAGRAMTQMAGNRFALDAGGPFPATVLIDARRLREVLENLLANANRHTHGGEVRLAFHAERAVEPGNVRLCFRVSDTGEGIAHEDVERIFLPFQRGAKQTTEHGAQGLGLGLAIAQQLVTLMGGDLRLERTSPQGSVFGFAFECATLEMTPVAAATVADERPALAGETKTLLVVEDVAESRALLAGMLRAAGFAVVEAANGRDALARLDTDVDLVLADQFMADGDGWDVLRGARAFAPSLPVVLVSAAEPLRPAGFPAAIDFDGILDKPLNEAKLFGLLGRLLALDWQPAVTSAATVSVPPSARRAELARLAAEGRVTEIEEWACALATESPAWTDYAGRVERAVLQLDFAELARLAGDPTDA